MESGPHLAQVLLLSYTRCITLQKWVKEKKIKDGLPETPGLKGTGGGTTTDRHMKTERWPEAEAATGLRLSRTGGK